ncbi:MAG TPA: hypothetical protein VJ908_07860 [Wenzhouxiangellaceae bacterium]|nr:hypothetical protein [Wenzhouxiangellaceae bacterium]
MISTSNLGRTFVMATAFAFSAFALAQDSSITISDGSNQCSASLVDLQVDTATGDVTANVVSLSDCAGPATPEITSFVVNGSPTGTTVDEGINVGVSWTSVNTSGCTAGGTLPSWSSQGSSLDPSGTFSASTTGLANGSYTLTLSCASALGPISASNNPTVTVQNSSTTGSCATRPPVPLTRATSIVTDGTDNARFFDSVFGPFPGTNNTKPIKIERIKYAAMEFTTDGSISPNATGDIESNVLQPLGSNTASGAQVHRMWSISKCPGDFRKHVLDQEMGPGCVKGGLGSLSAQAAFRFGGANFVNDTNVCALEPNTTYFVNLLYTSQEPPTTEQEHNALESTCPELFCGNIMASSGSGF